MLRIEVILGENDVMAISEGLKEIGIGGLSVSKIRGRGKERKFGKRNYKKIL